MTESLIFSLKLISFCWFSFIIFRLLFLKACSFIKRGVKKLYLGRRGGGGGTGRRRGRGEGGKERKKSYKELLGQPVLNSNTLYIYMYVFPLLEGCF